MGYWRFCVICGDLMETDNPFRSVCSERCERQREQEEQDYMDSLWRQLTPQALEVLGLESLDEYAKWKEEQSIGFVYFIQSGDGGPVKIGFSKDTQSRLRELQISSPNELTLLGRMEALPTFESELHERFVDLHIRGEWFEPGEPLLQFIHAL